MLSRGADACPSPPGAPVMLLGTNSPAFTLCPQRRALTKSAQLPASQKKAYSRLDTPHHTHLGLKGSSTDNIAITSCPEQACVSKGLRTRAASSGLLSHPGNSVGVRGCSQHTIRAEHRGQATMCNSALPLTHPAAPLQGLSWPVSSWNLLRHLQVI